MTVNMGVEQVQFGVGYPVPTGWWVLPARNRKIHVRSTSENGNLRPSRERVRLAAIWMPVDVSGSSTATVFFR